MSSGSHQLIGTALHDAKHGEEVKVHRYDGSECRCIAYGPIRAMEHVYHVGGSAVRGSGAFTHRG